MRKSVLNKLTRIITHRDPSTLPPWDVITKFFTVGSTHKGFINQVTKAGVFVVIEFGKHEIPCFIDIPNLTIACGLPTVGDVLTVRVASQNDARQEIEFDAIS